MSKVIDEVVLKKAITEVLQVVADNTFDFVEYESDEINALFDVESPEKLAYYESLINPDMISENRLWSSKTIADKIAESILQANEYSDDLIKNISSIQLEWCETSLPTTGETNKIYILPVTSGSDTVNTLNIWNSKTSAYVTIGNLEIDLSQYYTKSEMDTKLADKANSSEVLAVNKVQTTTGAETHDNVYSAKLTKTELDLKANDNEVVKKTDIVDNLTSTDIDKPLSANQGKVLKDEVDLKANDSDVVKKTDISTTIDGTSTNDTVPTNKAVYELNLRGTLIDQSVVDKYGTEIIKYPLGRWCIDGNDIAIKFSDIPWSTACIIDITSIISTRNPWDNTWSYRNYKAQTISKKGTFVRQLESRGTPGVLLDTGWQRVCTTSVADVPKTPISWTDETYFKSNDVISTGNYYQVRNGVCFVNIDITCTIPKDGGYILPIVLPKPTTDYVHANISSLPNGAYEHSSITIAVAYSGTHVAIYGGIANNRYLGTFSYPVAE